MNADRKINIPVYLVSLNKDVERREKLKERFPRSFDYFQHVEAVDGRALLAKEYFDKVKGFYIYHGRIMTPAELGCALSHIKALTEFLKTSSPHAMIIEDDIVGKDEDFLMVSDFVNSIFKDGIAYCGCQDGLLRRYKYGKPIGNGILKVSYSNRGEFSRTAAYVVSRSAAEVILSFHERKFITVADFWFDLLGELKGDVYYIPVLSHPLDMGNSIIESERVVVGRSLIEKLCSRDVFLLVYNRVKKEVRRFWYKARGHLEIGKLKY